MAGTRYQRRVHVGFGAPLTEAARTHPSTACESKWGLDLRLVFLSPNCSRSILVCQPSRRCTVSPIPLRSRYKCSFPTWTGPNAVFHLLPSPKRVAACTSSTTASESGRMVKRRETILALASHRLRVDGGRRFLRVRRLSNRLGLRHLRKRRARLMVRLVSTAPLT